MGPKENGGCIAGGLREQTRPWQMKTAVEIYIYSRVHKIGIGFRNEEDIAHFMMKMLMKMLMMLMKMILMKMMLLIPSGSHPTHV